MIQSALLVDSPLAFALAAAAAIAADLADEEAITATSFRLFGSSRSRSPLPGMHQLLVVI